MKNFIFCRISGASQGVKCIDGQLVLNAPFTTIPKPFGGYVKCIFQERSLFATRKAVCSKEIFSSVNREGFISQRRPPLSEKKKSFVPRTCFLRMDYFVLERFLLSYRMGRHVYHKDFPSAHQLIQSAQNVSSWFRSTRFQVNSAALYLDIHKESFRI